MIQKFKKCLKYVSIAVSIALLCTISPTRDASAAQQSESLRAVQVAIFNQPNDNDYISIKGLSSEDSLRTVRVYDSVGILLGEKTLSTFGDMTHTYFKLNGLGSYPGSVFVTVQYAGKEESAKTEILFNGEADLPTIEMTLTKPGEDSVVTEIDVGDYFDVNFSGKNYPDLGAVVIPFHFNKTNVQVVSILDNSEIAPVTKGAIDEIISIYPDGGSWLGELLPGSVVNNNTGLVSLSLAYLTQKMNVNRPMMASQKIYSIRMKAIAEGPMDLMYATEELHGPDTEAYDTSSPEGLQAIPSVGIAAVVPQKTTPRVKNVGTVTEEYHQLSDSQIEIYNYRQGDTLHDQQAQNMAIIKGLRAGDRVRVYANKDKGTIIDGVEGFVIEGRNTLEIPLGSLNAQGGSLWFTVENTHEGLLESDFIQKSYTRQMQTKTTFTFYRDGVPLNKNEKIQMGEILELKVIMTDIKDVSAIQMPIHFNPKVLQVVNSEGKSVPDKNIEPDEFNRNSGLILGAAVQNWNLSPSNKVDVIFDAEYPYVNNTTGLVKFGLFSHRGMNTYVQQTVDHIFSIYFKAIAPTAEFGLMDLREATAALDGAGVSGGDDILKTYYDVVHPDGITTGHKETGVILKVDVDFPNNAIEGTITTFDPYIELKIKDYSSIGYGQDGNYNAVHDASDADKTGIILLYGNQYAEAGIKLENALDSQKQPVFDAAGKLTAGNKIEIKVYEVVGSTKTQKGTTLQYIEGQSIPTEQASKALFASTISPAISQTSSIPGKYIIEYTLTDAYSKTYTTSRRVMVRYMVGDTNLSGVINSDDKQFLTDHIDGKLDFYAEAGAKLSEYVIMAVFNCNTKLEDRERYEVINADDLQSMEDHLFGLPLIEQDLSLKITDFPSL